MTYDSFIGIDPGLSGGIVLITPEKVEAHKMPSTNEDIFQLLSEIAWGNEDLFAYIEKVHTMPHDSKKAATTFLKHVGALEMVLVATDIPSDSVSPAVWQRSFGLLRKSKTETNTAKKNRHKAKAQELLRGTGIKVTHAIADAFLIGEWGKRKVMKNGS